MLNVAGSLNNAGGTITVTPTVNIVLVPPAEPGQSVQIQAEATDAVSYAWSANSPDVTFSDTTALQPSVSSDVQASYTLTLTGTSSTGDTAQDVATFSVTAGQVQDSSLTVTLTNMTSGTYLTTVFNPETAEVYSHGLKTWQGGSASFSLTGVAAGTFCEVWVRSTSTDGRGIQEGVTV
jgi:hypothetical protein